MIEYEGGGMALLLRMSGSVFPRVLPYAFVSAAINLVITMTSRDFFSEMFKHPYAHQVFSISVGFLLVFRSNLSYQRFWEGRTQVQQMSTKWDDAAMQVVAFEEISEKADKPQFLFTIVHLFSLLHAAAIQHLRGDSDLSHLVGTYSDPPEPVKNWLGIVDEEADDTRHELRVVGGLSKTEASVLLGTHARVYTILAWITRGITRRHKCGGLAVPPPILSRTYQVLSEGMGAFMQARKIQDTPFPFPYAQLVCAVLLVFITSAPVVVAAYVDNVFMSVLLSFVSSAASAALNEVAKEIEDPFGFDPNDLPLKELHEDYNQRVLYLLAGDTIEQDIFGTLFSSPSGSVTAPSTAPTTGPSPPQPAPPASVASMSSGPSRQERRRSSGGSGPLPGLEELERGRKSPTLK